MPAAIVLVASVVLWRAPVVGRALASVSWPWVAASLAANALSVVARAWAWDRLLRGAVSAPPPPRRRVLSAFSVAVLANAVLPGRTGEVARVVLVSRHVPDAGAWAAVLGTIFAHRALDVVPFAALLGVLFASVVVPRSTVVAAAVVLGVGAALLAGGIALGRLGPAGAEERLAGVRHLVEQGRRGFGVLAAPRSAAAAGGFELCGWSFEAVGVLCALAAFGVDVPLVAVPLVLVATNLATTFPLWPGNVGLYQAAVALPLATLGVAYAHGVVFALGLQAIELAVAVTLGGAGLAYEGMSFTALRATPALRGAVARRGHAPIRRPAGR